MSMLSVIPGVGEVVDKVLDKALSFIPDPEQRAKALQAVREMDLRADLAQLEVNRAEAASPSLFVAGWRPFVGWVCGAAFAYKFVVQPFLCWGMLIFLPDYPVAKLPPLDWAELSAVLGGLLGLGYYRTREKEAGVAR
jgi:Holin of 3TMs, for gene-transfer release